MDVESYQRWYDYTEAYDRMIQATDSKHAPWYRVKADNKKQARLNCITHLLSQIDYDRLPYEAPDLGKRKKRKKNQPKDIGFTHTVKERFWEPSLDVDVLFYFCSTSGTTFSTENWLSGASALHLQNSLENW